MARDKKNSETTFSPTRRIWGVCIVIASLFLLLSLFSYDWEDLSILKTPANDPPVNLIGPAGAWSGFFFFMLFGIGGYLAPFFSIVAACILMFSRRPRVWPRMLWCATAYTGLVLAIELRPEWWTDTCLRLNLADPGGVIGHLLTTSMLIRWLSPVGAGILIWSLCAISLVLTVGPQRLLDTMSQGFNTFRNTCSGIAALINNFYTARRKMQEEQSHKKIRRQAAVTQNHPKPVSKPAPQVRAKKKESEPKQRPTPPPPTPTPDSTRTPSGMNPDYQLPPISLMDPLPTNSSGTRGPDVDAISRVLDSTLNEFGVEAEVVNAEVGPVVTRYEILPAPGVRVERISALQNNLALALKATSVRVQAPVPGKGVVGIEVPNPTAEIVYLRDILESPKWNRSKNHLPLFLGKDVGGNEIVYDLARMPHMLIAGATGAGKTVCMNSILTGLLMNRTPEKLRLLLVDPKIVEFAAYNHLPHLVIPVVTDPKKVAIALRWAITEMENRYKMFSKVNVRNIESFNTRVVAKQEDLFEQTTQDNEDSDIPATVPYIVIVIDELADLMLTAGAEIENSIARLAQLSRAVGIHMIIATQRPSVNVITGKIKANFPARIAFQVAQKVDSRTILDAIGADKLLGRGDMLLLPPATGKLIRGQGALVHDHEINRIVDFIKQQGEPVYEKQIQEQIKRASSGGGAGAQVDKMSDEDDELLEQAVAIIRETGRASTSSLQRRLRIGYNRAGRLMDVLEEKGIVGPPRGSDPREILIDLDGEIPDNAASESEDMDLEEEIQQPDA
ncbi:MAG: DNA translocase FtsK 4TM domain-containing protein [Kiritimatiellae bacterium]|nr:DNA translocase FtsK 4TM domain-containing protein [Kiritimatiellia bacterium]